MLQMHHAQWLSNVSIIDLVGLLSNSDSSVGEFAVDLFENHASLSHLDMTTWLTLLDEANFSVLPTICTAMQRHIEPSRLSDEQLIQMTMARPATVAALGLTWLRKRHGTRPLNADSLSELSSCRCVWESEAIADWAIAELSRVEAYSAERIVRFFDAPSSPVRKSACNWLRSTAGDVTVAESTKANPLPQHDPSLWAKISETPYDEVRFSLIGLLDQIIDRSTDQTTQVCEALTTQQWLRIYSAVILCVDRGSRTKPKAITQLIELDDRDPEVAGTVIPVLAIASRSIRDPERFAALAGIATLIERNPVLASTVSEIIPEWNWGDFEMDVQETGVSR